MFFDLYIYIDFNIQNILALGFMLWKYIYIYIFKVRKIQVGRVQTTFPDTNIDVYI